MAQRCVWCRVDLNKQISWRLIVQLDIPKKVCATCEEKLVPITGELCLKCGRPLTKLKAEYIESERCFDCIRWQKSGLGEVLQSNRSFYEYNDFLKDILALYKFRGDVEAGRVFSSIFRKEIQKSYRNVDNIIPIPSSDTRLYERGFNQCAVWLEGTEFQNDQLLYRMNHEEKQSKKSREKRIKRTEEMFQLSPTAAVRNKTILLIDDIYTTGATIHYAAKTLKDAGASTIISLTLCRS